MVLPNTDSPIRVGRLPRPTDSALTFGRLVRISARNGRVDNAAGDNSAESRLVQNRDELRLRQWAVALDGKVPLATKILLT